jgi:hypothetical protein
MSDVKVLLIDLLLKDVMLSMRKLFLLYLLFTTTYLEKDKIKVAIVLFEEKACMWFYMLTKNCEN